MSHQQQTVVWPHIITSFLCVVGDGFWRSVWTHCDVSSGAKALDARTDAVQFVVFWNPRDEGRELLHGYSVVTRASVAYLVGCLDSSIAAAYVLVV